MYAHGSPGDEQKSEILFYWDELIKNIVSNAEQNLMNKAKMKKELD